MSEETRGASTFMARGGGRFAAMGPIPLWPSGRLRRLGFILRIVPIGFVGLVALIIINTKVNALNAGRPAVPPDPAFYWIWAACAWLGLCAYAQRLRDAGRTQWWLLAFPVPLAGPLLALALMFAPSRQVE
jgi:uncharacterized membrane protein YhaH (DUF805 family)